ncbi:glutamate ABC transporter substrate-binding protein [Thermomonospora curvata]|uniref:Extracellular solute-binding protein family 3 n=1 Tax=Thermomonospora curvata (strain ATCC 19995 / DSM 43183 / JCM 3096 / KCTC 9072 / NBRC 15933 / NCIMB 10081 / Henssen B9) TaxID=471852 RepID=D1AEH5_THECD|nr:glutamate ABC transporter substrate-binding protein [Thermomonospora curvata]ACY95791.1 extracellular solute-binding protein family 3 [Thermomonospora curvata DSM 43183]
MRSSRIAGRRAAAAASAVLAAVALAGCDAGGAGSILDKSTLRIGVKADQPGLGLKRPDGTFEGFDVDVARYVAGRLGFAEEDITFVETPSSVREQALQERRVDMIVATYSITAGRKTKVTFAGPYYVAHQDTLVRAGDGAVRNVRDLSGRRLCKVTGSNSWRRVTEERKVPARLVETSSYSDCVNRLLSGELDAVSTDDLILAGFAARYGDRVKIINAPISDEKYGIGLHKSDIDGCEAINTALTQMYQDGTARRLLDKWFGRTSLRTNPYVPQFEGCG